eukprot:gene4041-5783_t
MPLGLTLYILEILQSLAIASTLLIVMLLALGYLIYIKFKVNYIQGIPVVKCRSILGFTSSMFATKNSCAEMLSIANKNGKFSQYHVMGQHVVAVHDKVIAKKVLETVTGKGFFHRGLTGRNIFNLDTNSDWKIRRQAFRHSFTATSLRSFQNEVVEKSLRLCSILNEHCCSKQPVEIDKLFGKLTIDIICNIAFQLDIDALGDSETFQKLHSAIRTLFKYRWLSFVPFMNVIIKLPYLNKTINDYRNAKDELDKFAANILDHIQKLEASGELMENGLAAALLEFSSTPGITNNDIQNEILLMFIAGHETTAHTLSWFIYALCKNPDVQQCCLKIVETHKVFSAKELSKMPNYVEAVLKESMRKYPVVPRGSIRYVKDEDFVITSDLMGDKSANKEIIIPKNTWMDINFYVLHNSASNWGNDSNLFLPERWLSSDDYKQEDETPSENSCNVDSKSERIDLKVKSKVFPLESMAIYGGGGMKSNELMFSPFSFGPRNCLGMNLALIEIRTVIANLLQRYTFEFHDHSQENEGEMMEDQFTLCPKGYLLVHVKLRE